MIKEFFSKYQEEIILATGVILISLLSFALGYIFAKNESKSEIRFQETSYTESI
jgi:hypothetical protein